MIIEHLFESWWYEHKEPIHIPDLGKNITEQLYSIKPNKVQHRIVGEKTSVELRNSTSLVQIVTTEHNGEIKIYDPRWLHVVVPGQLPAQHLVFTTPTTIVIPGYIWWQALVPIEINWYEFHQPTVDF